MSRFGNEGEDIIGQWSEEKLDLLAKYLKAYSTIMSNQKTSNNPKGQPWLRAYYYIDAFAGSIRPRAKEDEQRYIDGSPIRALQTEPQFDAYWFIDISSQRIERVEKLRDDFPDRVIEIRKGNCNEILCKEIIPQILSASTIRAFVFLDPYGLQVDWDTIGKLAKTKTCDIFINFSVMGITRLLPRDQLPTLEVMEQLSRVMGSTDWINQIYQPSDQLSLFENLEPELSRGALKAEQLASLYAQQLSSLFSHVSKSVLMKNSTNSALYALCLASHNSTAVRITNEIFSRYERLRKPRN